MLASAELGDWEKLANLEQTRLPLFNQVFSHGVSGKEKLAMEILLVDQKTMGLAYAGMPVLQLELLSLRNSGKARNTYQAIQRFSGDDDQ